MTVPMVQSTETCESCQRTLATHLVVLEGVEPFAVCDQCARGAK